MMKERRAKPFHDAIADHTLMDNDIIEAGLAAPKQPQHIVGIPARMVHPAGHKSWKDAELPNRRRRHQPSRP